MGLTRGVLAWAAWLQEPVKGGLTVQPRHLRLTAVPVAAAPPPRPIAGTAEGPRHTAMTHAHSSGS